MKRISILLLFLGLMSLSAVAQKGKLSPKKAATKTMSSTQTKFYKGAWFSVRYPASFKAQSEMPSKTGGPGTYDSATFTSPDGTVTFCIYAPKYSTTIPKELFGDNFVDTEKLREGGITSYSSFYSPKYKRTCSYMAYRCEETAFLYVIGLRYTTYEAFEKYKKQYDAFKKSLLLYDD